MITDPSTSPAVPKALLLSPHLDDVAFSCGGVAATLAEAGWDVVVATIFTRSVHPAFGFALACQRDKHLPDDVDYMAIRREEDREACRRLGARQALLDLPEAPNRGYDSAAALFSPPRADDTIVPALAARITQMIAAEHPSLVLAPQGLGGHVDHVQLIAALLDACATPVVATPLGFYRDTPYVIRDAAAGPDPRIDRVATHPVAIPLDATARARKQAAIACYRTQLGFQFGGAAAAAAAIEALMIRESAGHACGHAERLLLSEPRILAGLAA